MKMNWMSLIGMAVMASGFITGAFEIASSPIKLFDVFPLVLAFGAGGVGTLMLLFSYFGKDSL